MGLRSYGVLSFKEVMNCHDKGNDPGCGGFV
jgi:hypothetical protein